MLSKRRWTSASCLLGGRLPQPEQRVGARLLEPRDSGLGRRPWRPSNLSSTTTIICIGTHPALHGALRSLAAACGVIDRPGGYASAPMRLTPAHRHSCTSAVVTP